MFCIFNKKKSSQEEIKEIKIIKEVRKVRKVICNVTKKELFDIIKNYARENYKAIGNSKKDIIDSLMNDLKFNDKEDMYDVLASVINIKSENVSSYICKKYNEYIIAIKNGSLDIINEKVNQNSNSSAVKTVEQKIPAIKVIDEDIDVISWNILDMKRFIKEVAEACEFSCIKENYKIVNKLIKQFNNLSFKDKLKVDYSAISKLQILNNKIERLK